MHLVYPQGAGGHFLASLLMNIQDDCSVDYYNTVYSQKDYTNRIYGRHKVETSLDNIITVYPSTEEYKKFCYKLYYYKKLYDGLIFDNNYTVIRTVDFFSKRCRTSHSLSDIINRTKQQYLVSKALGIDPASRAVISHILSDSKPEDILKDYKDNLPKIPYYWHEEYDKIDSKYSYTYEDIVVKQNVEGTIFEPYKQRIYLYHQKNIQLIKHVEDVLSKI